MVIPCSVLISFKKISASRIIDSFHDSEKVPKTPPKVSINFADERVVQRGHMLVLPGILEIVQDRDLRSGFEIRDCHGQAV